jgi:hypothetical protein
MASDGFRLWYQARHSADAAPVELPIAEKALREWASKTEVVPEKRKRGRPPKRRVSETALKQV